MGTNLNHEIKSFLDPALVFLLQVRVHPEVSPNIARRSLPILLVAVPFLLFPKDIPVIFKDISVNFTFWIISITFSLDCPHLMLSSAYHFQ